MVSAPIETKYLIGASECESQSAMWVVGWEIKGNEGAAVRFSE